MIVPGVNTYFPHYQELYNASKILLMVIKSKDEDNNKIDRTGKSIQNQIVSPFILTMFSVLECFLNELEDRIDKSSKELTYPRLDRPNMLDRPAELFEIITNKSFDKSTTIHADYSYVVMIRNLITHASGEEITWTSWDSCPINVQFQMNQLHFEKGFFQKYDLESKIIRNKKADKIIKYLADLGHVAPYYKGRSTGWIHYISFPQVAHWFFASIMNLIGPMIVEFAKSEDSAIKTFGEGAQRCFFDKIVDKYTPIIRSGKTALMKKNKTT